MAKFMDVHNGFVGVTEHQLCEAPTHPGHVASRPAPPDEMIGPPGGSPRHGRDESVLAELDATWDPGYADREAARHQSRKKSA